MASLGLILASMVSWEPTMRWSVILVSACGAIIILFRIWTKLYNVYLHPLAKFPGPPEAASSTAWMYSVLKSGSPEQQYEKLHKLYREFSFSISNKTERPLQLNPRMTDISASENRNEGPPYSTK